MNVMYIRDIFLSYWGLPRMLDAVDIEIKNHIPVCIYLFIFYFTYIVNHKNKDKAEFVK